ncbi:GntR family transcriptional regulator, partial [Microbispora corallina]
MDGSGGARYREIAADLRRRIESGELGPGDRVPSTREIMRLRGVAMATATKVLTELRREGLVRAVPGVGTVVDAGERPPRDASPHTAGPHADTAQHGDRPPRGASPHADAAATGGRVPRDASPHAGGSPAPASGGRQGDHSRRRNAPDGPLTSARIAATAVAIADVEGLAAISMRRVAAELGVATMSLYRHVADKDDLLLQMMEAVFARVHLPEDPPDDWRARVEIAARTLWASFRRHPWLAPAMSVTRPQPVPSALPITEWVLSALDGHGLDLPTMLTTHITVFNYVRGTAVNLELEAEAEELTGLNADEWMDTQGPALKAMLAGA